MFINAIESWIDAFTTFNTPVTFIEDLPAAGSTESLESESQDEITSVSIEEDDTSENTQQEETIQDYQENTSNNAWVTLSQDEIDSNMLNAAWENEKLPDTWAEHVLLLFVAVLLTAWFFYSTRKKAS